jgi:hypothetical protein
MDEEGLNELYQHSPNQLYQILCKGGQIISLERFLLLSNDSRNIRIK